MSESATRDDRISYILRRIDADRFISLKEISDHFGVNVQTARRDIASLAERSLVKRVHGGAVVADAPDALSVSERLEINHEEKQAIAEAALEFIEDDDVLFLDGGSTTACLAARLLGRRVHVLTNSLSLAAILGEGWPEIEINVTGGYYFPKSELFLGPPTLKAIEDVQVNKAFLSAAGVTAEGVFNANTLVAEVERAVVSRAAETYLLVDPSKLDRASLTRVCGFDRLAAIVTLPPVPESIVRAADAAGRRVVLTTTDKNHRRCRNL